MRLAIAASNSLFVIAFVFALTGRVQARTGGPDGGGYTFIDSNESGGPLFDYVDLSATGTRICSNNSCAVTNVSLGFTATMYGTPFTTVNISPRGNIQFESTVLSGGTLALPVANFGRSIFVWWGSMGCAPLDGVFVQTTGLAGSRRFIAQWHFSPLQNAGCEPPQFAPDFEVVLFESTNEVLINYNQTRITDVNFAHSPCRTSDGASAGIQRDALAFLEYQRGVFPCGNNGTDGLTNGLSVCYRPPGATGLPCVPTSAIANLNVVPQYGDPPGPREVSISITCTEGAFPSFSPLIGRADVSHGSAVFTIKNIPPGGTICTPAAAASGGRIQTADTCGTVLTQFSVLNCTLTLEHSNWLQIPGAARDIGVGQDPAGTVWVIGTNANGAAGNYGIFRRDGSAWTSVPGAAVHVAVDQNGFAWVVNAAGQIFRWDGYTWVEIPGGATEIAIGASGAVWIIGTNDAGFGGNGIYTWNGSGWTMVPGAGVRIAVEPSGNAWVVNAAGQIYQWNGFTWLNKPGGAEDIAIGTDGTLWVVGTNAAGPAGSFGLYQWNGSGWVARTGTALSISVGGSASKPWVVNSAGSIYQGQ